MVVIKANPDPEEYLEAENAFVRAVGNCVNQWAFVDRQLFRLFSFCLQTDTHLAAVVYYKQKTLSQHIQLVADLLKQTLPPDQFKADWKPLEAKLNELTPTRNIIVHSPVKRTGTSDGVKAVYIYEIYIEPYEQLLNKEQKGLKGKTALGLSDLEQHALDTHSLEGGLRALVHKLVLEAQEREAKPSA